jgi:hypothetical protein
MSNILPVLLTTRDRRINVSTYSTLEAACKVAGKNQMAWNICSSNWIAFCRKRVLDCAYEQAGFPTMLRGLIIDDDIVILNNPKELGDIIKAADEQNLNITANYQGAMGQNLIFNKQTGKRFTNKELADLAEREDFYDLEGTEVGTMGFYYGDLPRYYIWHQDSNTDEGTNFFRDNKQLNVKLAAKIKLSHLTSWARSSWVAQDYIE